MARMASSELLPGAASPWIFTLGTLVAGERWGSCRAVHREKAGKGDHVALFVADVVGRKIFDRRPPGGIRLQDDLLGAPPVREVVNVLPAPVGTYGRLMSALSSPRAPVLSAWTTRRYWALSSRPLK